MASIVTLNKMSLNNLIVRASDLELVIDGLDKKALAQAIFDAENEVVIADDIIVNEVSESGELSAHNADRVISSMKTLRAAIRKSIDVSLVNGDFRRMVKTVNGEAEIVVTFTKGAAKDNLYKFSCGDFSTSDQRAFYAHLKARFDMPAK